MTGHTVIPQKIANNPEFIIFQGAIYSANATAI